MCPSLPPNHAIHSSYKVKHINGLVVSIKPTTMEGFQCLLLSHVSILTPKPCNTLLIQGKTHLLISSEYKANNSGVITVGAVGPHHSSILPEDRWSRDRSLMRGDFSPKCTFYISMSGHHQLSLVCA